MRKKNFISHNYINIVHVEREGLCWWALFGVQSEVLCHVVSHVFSGQYVQIVEGPVLLQVARATAGTGQGGEYIIGLLVLRKARKVSGISCGWSLAEERTFVNKPDLYNMVDFWLELIPHCGHTPWLRPLTRFSRLCFMVLTVLSTFARYSQ